MGRSYTTRKGFPDMDDIENELTRLKEKRSWTRALRNAVFTVVTVAAAAVLIAMLFLPVVRITGTSMEPNLMDGDILVGVKSGEYTTGEICCFYYNNKILLKRVIGKPGDVVDMDEVGYVYLNGERLDEPYLSERSAGISDVQFPVQIPDGKLFVLGDHRATSVDSRSTAVGLVDIDNVVGRMLFRVWPLDEFGSID